MVLKPQNFWMLQFMVAGDVLSNYVQNLYVDENEQMQVAIMEPSKPLATVQGIAESVQICTSLVDPGGNVNTYVDGAYEDVPALH